MTASDLTRHALSWLRIRQHQGNFSEEERKGMTGFAEFLITLEEAKIAEPGTPLHSELIQDSEAGQVV